MFSYVSQHPSDFALISPFFFWAFLPSPIFLAFLPSPGSPFYFGAFLPSIWDISPLTRATLLRILLITYWLKCLFSAVDGVNWVNILYRPYSFVYRLTWDFWPPASHALFCKNNIWPLSPLRGVCTLWMVLIKNFLPMISMVEITLFVAPFCVLFSPCSARLCYAIINRDPVTILWYDRIILVNRIRKLYIRIFWNRACRAELFV